MPPPSKRPGRKDTIPLVISPSAPCRAQPVVVPRSSASKVRSARKAGGRSGIASCIRVVRVASAIVVSFSGWLRGWKTTAVMCLAVRAAVVGSERAGSVRARARGYPSTYGRRGQTCRLASPYVVWGLPHSPHVLGVGHCFHRAFTGRAMRGADEEDLSHLHAQPIDFIEP